MEDHDSQLRDTSSLCAASRRMLDSLSVAQRRSLLKRLDVGAFSGNRLVARALHQCGVERLSGICGTPADGIFTASQEGGLRVLGFRRQDAAILASAADNYSSRRLSHVVAVSAGPGITNTCTGILFAKDNHLPVLLLGTRRSLTDKGCGYFQEFDAVPMMRPLTKWAATVPNSSQLMPMIRKAIQIAISGNPGPVFLDIPEDVLSASSRPIDLAKPSRSAEPAPPEDVAQALKLIRQARAPFVCLGEGLHWSANLDRLQEFLESEQLPFITTPLARGIIPDDHPLCANDGRRKIGANCDLVLMAGAWFDWRFRNGAELNPQAKVIHAHLDPVELGRNVDCTLTTPCDPGCFLNQISQLSAIQAHPRRSQDWGDRVRSLCQEEASKRDHSSPVSSNPMHPTDLYTALRNCAPDDAIITVDGNLSLGFAQACLRRNSPASWFDPGRNGLIGGSLPLAMGLQLANPDRPVFALISDTSFGMSGMEWETCVRHHLPVIGIVANNNGNTGENRDRQLFPGTSERISSFQPGICYDHIARTLGARGTTICRPEQLPEAISKALDSNRPSCLNAILAPDCSPAPTW